MSVTAAQEPDQERIVALLASGSNWPVADVSKLYERERNRLARGARITNYLHIFATRAVQEILRNNVADGLASPLVSPALAAGA